MFCATFRFVLNDVPDAEEEFIECWTAFSAFFKNNAGALDSQLFRIDDGEYCACANWPDEETYVASRETPPDEAFMKSRLAWAELVAQTDIVFEGERVATA